MLTVVQPALGQLLVAIVGLQNITAVPVVSITDNGSAGWTQFSNSPYQNANDNAMVWYYKVATSTDVSSLTSVTFSWTNGASVTNGVCLMAELRGFVGTPTLDLHPAGVEVNSTTTTITGGVAAQATELALGWVFGVGAGTPTGTNTYSPDNGTDTYTWNTTTAAGTAGLIFTWAAPTAAPATASKWIITWSASHPTGALGATFYDPGVASTNSGFMFFMSPLVSMGIAAALANVILTQPGVASLTSAQLATLASWGVGGIVLGSNSGGGASWPYGFGGSAPFNSGGSNTYQNQLTAQAVLAHAKGIKCYLGIYLQNYDWGTVNTTNPSPCLGSWNPAFTDANGNGWGTQSTAGSWLKMCYDYGAAIAVMNLDGMYWDTEGGGIGSGSSPGSDFMVWSWQNYNTSYGSSSSQSQQNGWAQTAGANMMAAINAGFQSQGGNSAISGNQVPIITYQSTVAGLPQILNGYLDLTSAFTGTNYSVAGVGSVSYHTAIGYSTWTSFLTGVASETSAPVVLGDSTFYWQGIVTSSNIYSGDGDGGWARALSANRSALAALSLGSNIYISPFIWPYDATAGNGGGGIWSQAEWNEAIGPILTGLEDEMYMIFGFTNLLSGGTLVANYADNTYNSSPNINYTPLNT